MPVLREVEVYRKVDYDQTLLPGVVIMAIFLGAMTTGVFNIVMDKFMGIEESYLLTPLTRRDIVLGLTASGLVITTVIAFVVLFMGGLISGLYFWSFLTPSTLLGITVIIMLSTLSLQGLMFMAIERADHPRIVGVIGGFLNVILFFPSGAIYPIESLPKRLYWFSVVNPETYSVRALKAILFKGVGLGAIKWELLFLAISAAVMLTIATVIYKREL